MTTATWRRRFAYQPTDLTTWPKYAGREAVIEASNNYRAAYELLDGHLDITVANPEKNRLIAETPAKTDRLDAKRLAHLLHAGMVAESYVPEDEIREFRDLVRTRKSHRRRTDSREKPCQGRSQTHQ
ncbi:transposase [Natronorubrum sp. A-ect3]|uniref:IS110 family transposase n=1 Tax=Natronorubrum sp. A-ect3 TaxID=3242698 RepID=UPI00359EB817